MAPTRVLHHQVTGVLYDCALTYYTTKAAEYYTEASKYYTTKAIKYYTTTYTARAATPQNNYSAPSPITSLRPFNTTPQPSLPQLSTSWLPSSTPARHLSTTPPRVLHQPSTPRLPICFSYYTETSVYYTTTYASSNYFIEAPKYYIEKVEYCITTYAAPVYYTEEPSVLQASTSAPE
ncbi:LOW QUALITY PROTEIN: hypothetical protein DAPPUDRAFT_233374 [Daphnia pulex]|uniref:Uncharacterized protein n=1 Tax=Daphnia pulex TaxID=6669 RepID=E9FTX1_DAPPU|nr:LOW QUALITY PROTEIN: hypothetical protein DAPPUDRAFT_233374 [Daphnia pulex]|eukprot:EFX89567.1 LOW QUALITY PROTEIN: hypothetical protein DAPPUDRAFT_233374 [Daphnia pulex]